MMRMERKGNDWLSLSRRIMVALLVALTMLLILYICVHTISPGVSQEEIVAKFDMLHYGMELESVRALLHSDGLEIDEMEVKAIHGGHSFRDCIKSLDAYPIVTGDSYLMYEIKCNTSMIRIILSFTSNGLKDKWVQFYSL